MSVSMQEFFGGYRREQVGQNFVNIRDGALYQEISTTATSGVFTAILPDLGIHYKVKRYRPGFLHFLLHFSDANSINGEIRDSGGALVSGADNIRPGGAYCVSLVDGRPEVAGDVGIWRAWGNAVAGALVFQS